MPYTDAMRRFVLVMLACVFVACAEPPSKEMNQAQGAIDAAKSAGAEEFAATELTAAIDALRRSEDAVTQRDYRQALNHAIESRERAQSAAKSAVNARARTHGEVEAQLAEANTLLTQARARLREAAAARVPGRVLQDVRKAIDSAQTSVQNARTAVDTNDYVGARKALAGVSKRIQTAIASIEQAESAAAARKRR